MPKETNCRNCCATASCETCSKSGSHEFLRALYLRTCVPVSVYQEPAYQRTKVCIAGFRRKGQQDRAFLSGGMSNSNTRQGRVPALSAYSALCEQFTCISHHVRLLCLHEVS